MIEAETETAESPIKKAGQMVLTMGSTSEPGYQVYDTPDGDIVMEYNGTSVQ